MEAFIDRPARVIAPLNNLLSRRPLPTAALLWMLVVFLVASIAAGLVIRDRAHSRFESEFERDSTRLAVLIEKRFEVASQEMLLAAGFVRATDPTVDEWNEFVSSQGFLSSSSSEFITLLRPVNRADLATFSARERARGIEAFTPILIDPDATELALITRSAGVAGQSAPGLDLRGFPGAASPLDLTARTGEPVFLVIPPSVRAQGQNAAKAFGWAVDIGQALAILPIGREGAAGGHEGWIVVDMDVDAGAAVGAEVGLALKLASDDIGGIWANNEVVLLGGDVRAEPHLALERSFSTSLTDVTLQAWSLGSPRFGSSEVGRALLVGLLAALLVGAAWWLTDRIRHVGRWQREALVDPVTGLASRAGVRRELEWQLRRGGDSPALFMLDINRFKVVNESLGHIVGDQLLRVVGQRLSEVLGSDAAVGRFGGDEFVMIVPGIDDAAAAERLAERLVARVAEPITLGERVLNLSASVGIALGEGEEAVGFDSLLRDADAAVFEAKRRSRSLLVFDHVLRSRALTRLAMEQEIRQALEHDRFCVVYQPIVTAGGGEFVGVEALVRMRGADGELVPPGQFLPTAEETGLMPDIGRHVLRTALSDAARWNALESERAPLTVSVNIAESQLADPRLLEDVSSGLEEHGLDPRHLMLELSEDALVENLATLMETVEQLSALGVRLSIDDFGTGRSSLGHLRLLSLVDEVKIDRTFVNEVTDPGPSRDIISAVKYLAGSLSARVVAEGVETWEQWSTLSGMDIDLIQGFLVARPSPASTIDDWVRRPNRFKPEAIRHATGSMNLP